VLANFSHCRLPNSLGRENYKTQKFMKSTSFKKITIYSIVWLLVFIGVPLCLLYLPFEGDFGWYLLYLVLFLPVIFISSLVNFVITERKQNNSYKINLIIFIALFVVFYTLVLFWLYNGLQDAFGHMNIL
jgi:cation transport ATPase